jgi:hypothetical protein
VALTLTLTLTLALTLSRPATRSDRALWSSRSGAGVAGRGRGSG